MGKKIDKVMSAAHELCTTNDFRVELHVAKTQRLLLSSLERDMAFLTINTSDCSEISAQNPL